MSYYVSASFFINEEILIVNMTGLKKKTLSDWDRDVSFDNLCTQDLIVNVSQDSSDDFCSNGEEFDESL